MRCLFTVVAVSLTLPVVQADDRERLIQALFAFEALKSKQKAESPAPLSGPDKKDRCDCHDNSLCRCDQSPPCDCCQQPLPDYSEQRTKAQRSGLVLVAYLGTGGRGVCFDGAISGAGGLSPEFSSPTVLIGYGTPDGKVLLSEALPASSSRDQIQAAVKRATAKRDAAAKRLPEVKPVSGPDNWFTQVQLAAAICRT